MNVRALLKQVPTTAYLYAILATAMLSMYTAFAHTQREIGRREVLAAEAKAGERAARRELDSLTKAQKPQTVAATKWRIKWDTVKAGVDTAWLHDTIPVPVEVVRTVIQSADTAIKACTLPLQTCEQRVGVAQRGWDRAEDRIKILERQMPGRLTPWRHRAEGALVAEGVRALLRAIR